MGKMDEYQFDYLEDNYRFADQVNGALFQGRQIVKPDELEPAEAQSVYLGKEAGARENFKAIVDKTRMWKGRLLHILAVENQAYVDYHMILRNMLSESISYQKQWKQKKAAHERAHDLKAGTDEFLSGMVKDEKFIPVITLVVYYGTEHPWNGARCLHDLLELEEGMKKFVTNYRLNLYDCHEHDTFDEYHTGLRQLFEVVRYGKDKDKLQRIMQENKDAYSRMDSDTRELLEVAAKIKVGEEYEIMENGEKKYDMCKAFADMKLEGVMEGRLEGKLEERQEHLVKTVCIKLRKNKPAEIIADELEEELSEIEKVIEAQRLVGNYDMKQICMAMVKQDHEERQGREMTTGAK